jgi:hypothetical protein
VKKSFGFSTPMSACGRSKTPPQFLNINTSSFLILDLTLKLIFRGTE